MSECQHPEWKLSDPIRYSFPTCTALTMIFVCTSCGAETDGLFFPEPFPEVQT